MNDVKMNDAECIGKVLEELKGRNEAYLRGRMEGEEAAISFMRAKLEEERKRSAQMEEREIGA